MASILFLLVATEARFNSYSLNSNSVGQDVGVSSMLTLRLHSKALSPAEVPLSSLRLLRLFLFFLLRRSIYTADILGLIKQEKSNSSYLNDPFSFPWFATSYFYHVVFLAITPSLFVESVVLMTSWETNDFTCLLRDSEIDWFRCCFLETWLTWFPGESFDEWTLWLYVEVTILICSKYIEDII